MRNADEIAWVFGVHSISAFVAMLRRFASEPECDNSADLYDAANVIERLSAEVDCLKAEVERLTDKIDDLKEEMRNHQES
jgi:predicted RNase H-like nuclease (RuvC/YqgF family)